jgi:hypothetical protein
MSAATTLSQKVTARLVIEEAGQPAQSIDLPVHVGTDGKRFVDVSGLGKNGGVFTIDPGFVSTASCRSAISLIDGRAGRLLYRGYRVEALAERSSFREVTFLLLHGHLPSAAEFARFESNMAQHSLVHEKIRAFYQGFTTGAHPMSIMCGVMGALSSFYHDSFDISDRRRREQAAYRIVAKMPTIAAMAYKYSIGQPFVYPRNELSYAHNFLRMMFAVPSEEYVPHPVIVRALDTIMMLHADHGQNASTSTARIAGSSQANPFGAWMIFLISSCLFFVAQSNFLIFLKKKKKKKNATQRKQHTTQYTQHASPRRSPRCGAPRTVVPTRPCSRCCARCATRPAASTPTSRAPRTARTRRG